VPHDQAPLFHVPGPHGRWYISLLFGHGSSVDVPMQGLRKLLAGSRGEVIVARRITRAEVEVLERERGDSDAAVHGGLIVKEVSVRSNAPIAGSVRGPAGLDDGRPSLDAKYGTS
jgi:hypothetical protein